MEYESHFHYYSAGWLSFKCGTQCSFWKTLKFPMSHFAVELKRCEQRILLCKCVTFIPRNKMRLRWLLIRLHGWCNLVLPLPHTHTRKHPHNLLPSARCMPVTQSFCAFIWKRNDTCACDEEGIECERAKRISGPWTKANDLFLLAWRNRKRSIYTMYRFDDMTIILHKIYGYVLILFSSSVPYYIYWFDLSCYEICETCNYRFCKPNSIVIIFILFALMRFPPTQEKRTGTSTLIRLHEFRLTILIPSNTWFEHIHGECRHLIRLPGTVSSACICSFAPISIVLLFECHFCFTWQFEQFQCSKSNVMLWRNFGARYSECYAIRN